jgi:hypothetical protein
MKMETESLSSDIPILENTSLLLSITLYTHRGRMPKEKKRISYRKTAES